MPTFCRSALFCKLCLNNPLFRKANSVTNCPKGLFLVGGSEHTKQALANTVTLPKSNKPCAHRGERVGTCSCGATKHICNLTGVHVRSFKRAGHPNDIVCSKDCPHYKEKE